MQSKETHKGLKPPLLQNRDQNIPGKTLKISMDSNYQWLGLKGGERNQAPSTID